MSPIEDKLEDSITSKEPGRQQRRHRPKVEAIFGPNLGPPEHRRRRRRIFVLQRHELNMLNAGEPRIQFGMPGGGTHILPEASSRPRGSMSHGCQHGRLRPTRHDDRTHPKGPPEDHGERSVPVPVEQAKSTGPISSSTLADVGGQTQQDCDRGKETFPLRHRRLPSVHISLPVNNPQLPMGNGESVKPPKTHGLSAPNDKDRRPRDANNPTKNTKSVSITLDIVISYEDSSEGSPRPKHDPCATSSESPPEYVLANEEDI